ncbi:hypothetical protein VB776_06165 [Arcicella sp. DC2W]|uniref:Uncharacterized protein n=1 Tax=Arcicella gelida TaxID=2984195 RepID=A0ABU5S1Z1_9BACT|nr:hypothetical protein [Arcicella sp. DC2W]MEA5402490.1 hypothetical protein [Arcicella sp. DC2W]
MRKETEVSHAMSIFRFSFINKNENINTIYKYSADLWGDVLLSDFK